MKKSNSNIDHKQNLESKSLIIEISSDFYRPAEVELLVGDASKAKKDLKWKPKYNFKSLIREMIHFELNK